MKQKLLLLTLNTFSATGGIEKVCRVAAKALHEIAEESGSEALVYSAYDDTAQANASYFPTTNFRGFAGRRLAFLLAAVRQGRKSKIVLLSHINLLPVGYLIKKVAPKTKLFLVAHGIEVWGDLGRLKQKTMSSVDLFLSVSSYTANKLQSQHGIASKKIKVLNNCLDPFLRNEKEPDLEKRLRKKYGMADDDFVLLTVTRLKFSEQYKGYDKVVRSIASLKVSHPKLKYLIVGKWDEEEKFRLDKIIAGEGVKDSVVFAGFVKDEELSAHFHLADTYIMPSTGEGFGIVFIEALFYGLPVIAGNVDGSVDALANGEFGLLVNPNNAEEIKQAIEKVYKHKDRYCSTREAVLAHFGFETYKARLRTLLNQSNIGEVWVGKPSGNAALKQGSLTHP